MYVTMALVVLVYSSVLVQELLESLMCSFDSLHALWNWVVELVLLLLLLCQFLFCHCWQFHVFEGDGSGVAGLG